MSLKPPEESGQAPRQAGGIQDEATLRRLRTAAGPDQLKTASGERLYTPDEVRQVVRRLVAGIGDILSNHSSVVYALAADVSRVEGLPPQAVEFLDRIRGRERLVSQMVDRIGVYSRAREPEEFRPLDLNNAVRAAVETNGRLAGAPNVQVDLRLAPEAAVVVGERDDLVLMVGNFIDNSVAAMPDGGRMTVETRVDRDSVVLRVSDTGMGIPAQDLPHVLEPFHKRSTSPMGLGLSINESIVHAYGGAIAAESEEGKGAAFTVTLPRATEQQTAEAGRRKEGVMRVLVVEPGATPERVRMQILLGGQGHRVTTVGSEDIGGRTALDALREGQYDVVMTELTMPNTDGRAVARAAKECKPAPTVVAATMQDKEIDLSGPDGGLFDHVLPKPYSSKQVAALFERIIAERTGAQE